MLDFRRRKEKMQYNTARDLFETIGADSTLVDDNNIISFLETV